MILILNFGLELMAFNLSSLDFCPGRWQNPKKAQIGFKDYEIIKEYSLSLMFDL